MKIKILKYILLFVFFNGTFNLGFSNTNIDSLLVQIQKSMEFEVDHIANRYHSQLLALNQFKEAQNKIIKQVIIEEDLISLQNKVLALQELYQLDFKIKKLQENYQIEISKIRYKKGLEMIRIIYNKTLSLDHHFTSLKTFQNISTLSNPNSFPEFIKSKDVLNNRLDKKQSVTLPKLLQANPFVSLTQTLVSSFIGGGDKKIRERELDKIACIFDFTVRMNSDLNIVYYETEYLKKGNQSLKEECIVLFKNYTKVIGYTIPLDECKKEDDWDSINSNLDKYVNSILQKEPDEDQLETYQKHVNLVFSIDRLFQFMDKYSRFISQGERYYQKFNTILNNYENEAVCQSQMPQQFNELKRDVKLSITKFNEAYNISELQGSKLRDLMYGIE